jgi:rare lipoprotein A
MRTRLMIVGLCGLWLTPMPAVASGGPAKTTQVKATPVGLASWYGKPHQGRTTASGQRFSRQQLTAAHRS